MVVRRLNQAGAEVDINGALPGNVLRFAAGAPISVSVEGWSLTDVLHIFFDGFLTSSANIGQVTVTGALAQDAGVGLSIMVTSGQAAFYPNDPTVPAAIGAFNFGGLTIANATTRSGVRANISLAGSVLDDVVVGRLERLDALGSVNLDASIQSEQAITRLLVGQELAGNVSCGSSI